MPKIGEIRKAKEIGYQGYGKHAWLACPECGEERWVELRRNKPRSVFCVHCCKKGDRNWRWLGQDGDYYERRRANQRRHYSRHKEKYQAYAKAHQAQANLANKKYNRGLKLEVLSVYGGSPPQCACCGEGHIEFLSIDHINGGGNKHRKTFIGPIYNYLKRNNYPSGYRVLCMNCNTAIGFYGYCPHSKKGKET